MDQSVKVQVGSRVEVCGPIVPGAGGYDEQRHFEQFVGKQGEVVGFVNWDYPVRVLVDGRRLPEHFREVEVRGL